MRRANGYHNAEAVTWTLEEEKSPPDWLSFDHINAGNLLDTLAEVLLFCAVYYSCPSHLSLLLPLSLFSLFVLHLQVLWLLSFDDKNTLADAVDKYCIGVPPIQWLAWIPQLLTCLVGSEGKPLLNLISQVRLFYLLSNIILIFVFKSSTHACLTRLSFILFPSAFSISLCMCL